ncbi:MAG: TonB-dependent receptor, partial [Cytophagales bacterium]|nr:TonB-dependent receptor [Cytophagales bacterium]
GHPIDVLHRFEVVGIFQEGENIVDNTHQPDAKPGDLKLYDRDPEDGQLNATDRVITSLDPEWYGSFNLNVEYKGFDFTATVYTVQGIVKDNPYLYQYSRGGSLRAVFSGIRQNYWTPENPTGNWPRPNAGIDPENMFALGTQDASYIRLQNVTVGYSLPNRLIPGLGINRLRLYATGQNLFTWTDYQSYSPEKTPDQYPEAIMITGGIQLGF